MELSGVRRIFSRCFFTVGLIIISIFIANEVSAIPIFVNEIHYDNSGGDTGEAVEIAGPVGSNLIGWSLALYNGNGGGLYRTVSLNGIIPNQQASFGTLSFLIKPIQNGAPDGFALIDFTSAVVQFLSYEGTFIATDGPANGLSSMDIGVVESGSTLAGHSLQLAGTGKEYEDFTWEAPGQNTFGHINRNQIFKVASVPEPDLMALIALGLIAMGLARYDKYSD